MDIGKIVRDAHEAGRLLIGSKSVIRGLKAGNVSQVVFASNCPENRRKPAVLNSGKAEVVEFNADSARLGETCGKPFTVLMVGVKSK